MRELRLRGGRLPGNHELTNSHARRVFFGSGRENLLLHFDSKTEGQFCEIVTCANWCLAGPVPPIGPKRPSGRSLPVSRDSRSEERRVGKERRSRWSPYQ